MAGAPTITAMHPASNSTVDHERMPHVTMKPAADPPTAIGPHHRSLPFDPDHERRRRSSGTTQTSHSDRHADPPGPLAH